MLGYLEALNCQNTPSFVHLETYFRMWGGLLGVWRVLAGYRNTETIVSNSELSSFFDV
jgi:hypothetical protein